MTKTRAALSVIPILALMALGLVMWGWLGIGVVIGAVPQWCLKRIARALDWLFLGEPLTPISHRLPPAAHPALTFVAGDAWE